MAGNSSEGRTTKADWRSHMLRAINAGLQDPSGALIGIDSVLERGGCSRLEILSAFGSIDDLLVNIAERKAAFLSAPLVTCGGRISDVSIARHVLTEFGTLAWKEYSTSLIALVRLMMAEGTRSPNLRARVYEVGPASVALKLQRFFAEANAGGILTVPESHLAAEQLMAMLREPLYQALTLHPTASSTADEAGAVAVIIDHVFDGCRKGRTNDPHR